MVKFRGDLNGRRILIVTMILSLFGMVAVLSASAGTCAAAAEYGYNSLHFFERQVAWFIVSVAAMFGVRKYLDLEKHRRWLGLPLLIFVTFLSFCVLFTTPVNGARRWLTLGPIRFQVGELAKLALIFYWADFLSRHRKRVSEELPACPPPLFDWRVKEPPKSWFAEKGGQFLKDVLPVVPPMAITGLLIFFIEYGKDLGTVLVIGATLLFTLWVAGVRKSILFRVLGGGAVLALALILKEPYRLARVLSWGSPMDDPMGMGYQVANSLIAISSGGWFGVGLPFSMQKFDYLPEQHCDFIYAIICEELGLTGTIGLLLLYAALIISGLRLAVHAKHSYQSLLAFGITMQVAVQALFNIGVVTGIFPNKGLPLPFISYGGSSLFCCFVGMGVLLNISDHLKGISIKAPRKTKKGNKARKGSTLSSSEQSVVKHVSSGEWESVVSIPISRRAKQKYPKPIVEPTWGTVLPFEPGKRAMRERIRRQQAR